MTAVLTWEGIRIGYKPNRASEQAKRASFSVVETMGLGHGDDDESRVLPVIDEEEPDDQSEGSHSPSPETMKTDSKQIAERRKAIMFRMRELLRRAAAAQSESAHTKLRRSTVATAKKWKRVVGRIQNRGGRVTTTLHQDQDDAMMMSRSSSSPVSSSIVSSSSNKSSFSWDAAAMESCPSPYQLVSSPVIRLSCTSARIISGSDDDMRMRMAHWVTTDSDFVVLEL